MKLVRLFITLAFVTACSASTTPVVESTATPISKPVVLDSDGDGVPDVCDQCPMQPGINRADHPYGRGCPYIDSFADEAEFLQPWVRFDKDDAHVKSLAELAKKIVENHGVHVFVVGHASTDEKDPEALAEKRANAVVDELAARGVDRASLEARWAGAAHPEYGAGHVDLVASRRVSFDVARNHAHSRTWNEARREVDDVVIADIPCPQSDQPPP